MSRHHLSTRRMKETRRAFKAECREANAPCWLCGQADVDFETQGEDDSFELDHFYPVSTHPQFADDPANYKCSHRLCNIQRGNKSPDAGLGTTSEEWL